MPILGVIASSKLTAVAGDFEFIGTFSPTGTTVSFTSIPQTYKHLQIRGVARSDRNANTGGTSFALQFNSDTGSNYTPIRLRFNGGTNDWITDNNYASSYMYAADCNANQFVAGQFTTYVIDIYNYTNTNFTKTTIGYYGGDNNYVNSYNGAGGLALGGWGSTSAINRIDCYQIGASANNFIAGSKVSLYGIKG